MVKLGPNARTATLIFKILHPEMGGSPDPGVGVTYSVQTTGLHMSRAPGLIRLAFPSNNTCRFQDRPVFLYSRATFYSVGFKVSVKTKHIKATIKVPLSCS